MTTACACGSVTAACASWVKRATPGMFRRTSANRSSDRSQTVPTRASGWVANARTRLGPQWPTPTQLTVIIGLLLDAQAEQEHRLQYIPPADYRAHLGVAELSRRVDLRAGHFRMAVAGV